ncbi:MAG: hypothetical protein Q8P13_02410 [bacterium]|nr:hypothetical protein [bacterium]
MTAVKLIVAAFILGLAVTLALSTQIPDNPAALCGVGVSLVVLGLGWYYLPVTRPRL